jgi:hypothetical protein
VNAIDLYPHLPRAWRDRVTLALRGRGASGATIGEALALAESHCADSGEHPEDAFGDPQAYAASVPVAAGERTSAALSGLWHDAWPTVLGLAGLLLALACARAWGQGDAVAIPLGAPVALAVIIAASVLLVARPAATLGNPLVGGVLLAVTLIVVVVLQVTLREPSVRSPLGLATGAALLLLGASVVGTRRRVGAAEVVVDPLHGDPTPRATAILSALTPWLFPLATLIGVALEATLP